MTNKPVLEAAGGSSEEFFHCGLHLRFELWMIAEDVEAGLRVLRRELLPSLVVGDRLKGQRSIQRGAEPRDLRSGGVSASGPLSR